MRMSFVICMLYYCNNTVVGLLAKATTSYRSIGRRDFTNMKHLRSSITLRDSMRVTNSRNSNHASSTAIARSTDGTDDVIVNSPSVTNQNLYRPMKIMGEKKNKPLFLQHIICP